MTEKQELRAQGLELAIKYFGALPEPFKTVILEESKKAVETVTGEERRYDLAAIQAVSNLFIEYLNLE